MTEQSAHELGLTPSPNDVDHWFVAHAFERSVAGQTYLGREIFAYSRLLRGGGDAKSIPTVLFISMVHGNEPNGLVTLLHTAEALLQESNVNLIFFPIVNLDAYLLNLEIGKGCRRTNLRHTCSEIAANTSIPCQSIVQDGVDLNRNFHESWDGLKHCSFENGGTHPLSEPETQAIANLVSQAPNLVAAMSFHSRRQSGRDPLLIHPYASEKSISNMPKRRCNTYRKWSQHIVEGLEPRYITGTAKETIHYTAGGTTMDWLDEQGIYAFVAEIVPTCKNRWCSSGLVEASADLQMGVRLARIAAARNETATEIDDSPLCEVQYPPATQLRSFPAAKPGYQDAFEDDMSVVIGGVGILASLSLIILCWIRHLARQLKARRGV